jgi:hypothetical protein
MGETIQLRCIMLSREKQLSLEGELFVEIFAC